ncbi:MAG: phage distal tail protein, Rcc01695 family [Oceanicaulis sp.]
MSAFHDVRFPLSIGLNARGGPERRTEIVTLGSGREERNSPWAGSRRRWDAAPGVRSLDDVAVLTAFFEARRGRLYAFRFADPMDHKSCAPSAEPSASDQLIAVGDGAQTVFALTKTYGQGETAYVREIAKPVAGSVLVAVNGGPAAFTVDSAGRVVFDAAPADGAPITAGYRFDTPARFDTDALDVTVDGFRAGDIASVPLAEVRL